MKSLARPRNLGVLATACVLAVASLVAARQAAASGVEPTRHASVTTQHGATTHEYSQSMERLLQAAQRLRESIQALAQRPPGQHRDDAIASAHNALVDTQHAMLALPPEQRERGPGTRDARGTPHPAAAPRHERVDVRSGGSRHASSYDHSLDKLQSAAQRLRESVQAMAQQPAGERRNQAMHSAHDALIETQQAMILTAAVAQDDRERGRTRAHAGMPGSTHPSLTAPRATAALPVVILAPPTLAVDDRFGNGCWARLYDEENFRGDALTVVGPVAIADARAGSDFEWGRNYDSVVVGPRATLIVFDNENFGQHSGTIDAGERIADLDHALGPFDNLRSLRLDCAA